MKYYVKFELVKGNIKLSNTKFLSVRYRRGKWICSMIIDDGELLEGGLLKIGELIVKPIRFGIYKESKVNMFMLGVIFRKVLGNAKFYRSKR